MKSHVEMKNQHVAKGENWRTMLASLNEFLDK